MFKNLKIATKLILIGGLLILIPLVVVGVMAVNQAGRALNAAVDEELSTRSSEIAKLVDGVLQDQLKLVTALSIMPDTVRVAEALKDRGRGGAVEELDGFSRFLQKFIRTGSLGNQVQLVGMVDLQGIIVSASDKKYFGVNVEDRSYFRTARIGKTNIGEVALNKVTGKPFISFATPVQSDDGQVKAILMYIYDIGYLNSLVADEKIGKTGYAYLIDRTGLLISHPNPKHVMKTNLSRTQGMETFVGYMKDGKSGVDRYVFEGISKTAGYAPVKSTGWSVGLTMPDDEYLEAVTTMTIFITIVSVVAVLIALVAFFLFALSLAKNLKKGVVFAESMSNGDMSRKLDISRNDEIGDLAGSLNQMVNSLSGMILKIRDGSETLSVTSSELRNIAEFLSVGSDDTASKANSVSVAAEEMNANIESVAAAMEQASSNVNNIAAAVEEMNAGFKEITDQIGRTREDTSYAAEVSDSSSAQINQLGIAAAEIESITETIYNIADKTSLLALNATIEAARAGDAGKGFAVVAGEIKGLAQQVSASTGDIGKKISAIQQTTEKVTKGNKEIVEIIAKVGESVETITTAMQQQNAATSEIAENINQTSSGIREINENIFQTSQAVSQVTMEIGKVNQSATDINSSSTQVKQKSDSLTALAQNLQQQVSAFTIKSTGFSAGPVKMAHSRWKKKLSELLTGQESLQESDVSSHHECEFGKWYFGEGVEKFSDCDTFKEIDARHEKVHSSAKEIARAYNEGNIEEANHLFAAFSGVTESLFELLDKLEEEATD